MKKLMLTTLIAAASFLAVASNILEDVKVSAVIRHAFVQEFGQVKNVTWQNASNDMLRADFLLDEEKVSAFFSRDGEHVATTIQKETSSLSAKLRKAIVEKFGDKQVQELFELISDDDYGYFFTIKNDETKTIYKAYSSGSIKALELKRGK